MQPGVIVAGKYRVARVIGRGGMGVVVEATHLQLESKVALKFLDEAMTTEPTAVARFTREARAAAQLKSEHICRVIDFGVEGRMPYIVMELLTGTDLARLGQVRKLDVPTAALYIKQACLGLAEAHAAQIIHRDLKPSNLFLTRRADGSPLIKVVDFGVAKAPAGTDDVALTGTSHVVGSPGFMSPEQFRSSKSVDGRTDVWSLGVILYKLVSGTLPFKGEGFAEFALSITRDPTPSLRDVPPASDAIVARCLQKDVGKRYPDVNALAEALAPYAALARRSAPVLPSPDPAAEPPTVDSVQDTAALPEPARPAMKATILGAAPPKLPTSPSSSLVVTAPGTQVGTGVPRHPTGQLPPGQLPPGSVVGEYTIERKIGQGGMGVVYAAIHPLIGKKAAIKVIGAELGTDSVIVQRFVQEARSVNQIGHPNIVDVFAFGELPDGRNYFVMELLQGESLRERLTRALIPLTEGIQIVDEIAAALEAAHEQQIVHRDLKPDNVFLAKVRDSYIVVKLLDFGIAMLAGGDAGIAKTSTGEMIGTPAYLSPEQARGKNVDYRTDIYALGCMLFEVVTGRMPFMAESAMDIVLMHLSAPPRRPSELVPDVPPALEQIILQTLEKDPDKRPSLAEVRNVFAELVASGLVPIEHGSKATFRSELARSRRESELRTPRSSPRNQLLGQPPSSPRNELLDQPAASSSEPAPDARGPLVTARRRTPSPSESPTSVAFRPGPNTITPASGVHAPTAKPSRRGLAIGIVVAAFLVPVTFIAIAMVNKLGATDHRHDTTTTQGSSNAIAQLTPDAASGAQLTPDAASVAPADAAAVASTAIDATAAIRDVQIHVNVATAVIVIDGSVVKSHNGTATIALADGVHMLVATAAGRLPFERELAVSAATANVEITLERVRKSSPTTKPDPDHKATKDPTNTDYTIDPFK